MSKTVCFRVSDAQHDELLRRAGDKNVSIYVREQLLLDIAEHDPFAELHAELERKAQELGAAYGRIDELLTQLSDVDRRLQRLEALAEGSDY